MTGTIPTNALETVLVLRSKGLVRSTGVTFGHFLYWSFGAKHVEVVFLGNECTFL